MLPDCRHGGVGTWRDVPPRGGGGFSLFRSVGHGWSFNQKSRLPMMQLTTNCGNYLDRTRYPSLLCGLESFDVLFLGPGRWKQPPRICEKQPWLTACFQMATRRAQGCCCRRRRCRRLNGRRRRRRRTLQESPSKRSKQKPKRKLRLKRLIAPEQVAPCQTGYCQGRDLVMPIYLATDNYSAVALQTNVGGERVNLKTVGGEHVDEVIKARGRV